MKVYFEESGFGCDGKGNNTVGINIYVNPDGNGSAYHYDKLGELCCFSWVYPDKARVIESDVLPDDLWYSITHGVDHADVPQSLSKYKWNIDDLVYTKVNKAKVEAYKKVVDALPSVKTIEDFKQIYPLIKESGTISTTIIDKLFGLMGIKHTEARNGEIGIAFAHDLKIYEQCIHHIFSKENMKPRIYLSGPISGHDIEERRKAFKEVQTMLEAQGWTVFNPLENGLPSESTTHEHMHRDLAVLTTEEIPFKAIFMMRKWTHSAGCKLEFDVATAIGLDVYFEDNMTVVKFE